MIEVLILCGAMYILYIYCEIQYITVKFGSLLIIHDKQSPDPPQLEGGGEVTRRVIPPTPHLSFASSLNPPKKPQDKKKMTKNKKNKKNNDAQPVVGIPKERGIKELKEALTATLINTL